jgi:hypothetical protein
MIVNPYLQALSIGTRPPGAPGQGTTCRFSGSYQVVMSNDLPKNKQKNKRHVDCVACSQNCFQYTKTIAYVENTDYLPSLQRSVPLLPI